jgi:chromosome partitioning protein
MRRIAVINQKGGVGKTTTCANLGAALARLSRRVVLVDMDAQANLSMHMAVEVGEEEPSSYSVLRGKTPLAAAIRETKIPGLSLVPSHLELSGAELELASTFGRETLLRIAVEDWEREERARTGAAPADYLIFDCPPSLGLLSINALAAASEVLIALQTEFFALQGMSTLVDVVQLLKRRLHPSLEITGILPCLYDSRLKLAREVLAEIRTYFPGKVFRTPVRSNIKLAEAPSFGQTIFEYAPESNGALDYLRVAEELLEGESRDPELAAKPRAARASAPDEETSETHVPSADVPAAEALEPLATSASTPANATTARESELRRSRSGTAERAASALRIPPAESTASIATEPLASATLLSPPDAAAPVEIEARIDAWIREERTENEPALTTPLPAPAETPAETGERTYVLTPTPRQVPVLATPQPVTHAGTHAAARPNDLLSLCLRSLRSLWRS